MFINPSQTIQDLRNAIEYLDTHDWIQGFDFNGRGGCCAHGALRGVTGDDNPAFVSEQTRDRVSNAARAFYRVIGDEITTYNDTDGRTKGQVIRALETVVDTLEKDPSRA